MKIHLSRHPILWAALSTSALTAMSSPAIAADGGNTAETASAASADAPVANAGDSQRADIVVTALKRATSVQKTPLSISAITEQGLTRMGATSINDFYREIPNMEVEGNSPTARRITLRGIRASGEATVGLYYDETPLTGPNGTSQDSATTNPDINLFDVQRVEVLRGPQGTLYGSGSMGGTMRIIFNKANTERYEGTVEGEVSGTKDGGLGYSTKGVVNVPIIKGLLGIRLLGYNEKRAGWVDAIRLGESNINGYRNYGGRALVTLTPASNVTIYGSASLQRDAQQGQEIIYPALGKKDFSTNAYAIGRNTDNLHIYNLTGKVDFPFGTLTVTGSRYTWNLVRSQDNTASSLANATSASACKGYFNIAGACTASQLATWSSYVRSRSPSVTYQPQHLESWNTEARLSGTVLNKLLDYTVGVFYEHRKDRTYSDVARADATTGRIIAPLDLTGSRTIADDQTQTAFFADLTLHPTSKLSLTAGARHFDYSKTVSGQVLQTNYISSSYVGPATSVDAGAKGWVSKFGANYQINNDLMVYISASKGFRPGGANNVPGLGASLVSFQPDSLWDYEGGFKSQWLDGLLTVNGTGFMIDWKNIQVSTRTTNGAYVFITNAGAARIWGGEGELSLRPMRGLNLTTNLGYTNAYLTEDQVNTDAAITASTGLAGDKIPNIPKFNASFIAEYSFPITQHLSGLLRGDVTHNSSSASQFRPTYVYYARQPGYETVNLRAGVESDGWSAYVFADNVTNYSGYFNVSAVAAVQGAINSFTPRTIGINVRKSF